MDHLPRSSTYTTTTFSRRDFESDTWLILGVTAAIFAALSAVGIFILCYRRRGHKRRMDKKRMSAGKSRGKYVPLDEEKGPTERHEEVPLTERAPAASPTITPPPLTERMSRSRSQSQSQSLSILFTPSPPTEPNRRRGSSPQPQLLPPVEPQIGFASVNLQHPQPQGVYLPPPVVSNERGGHFHFQGHNDDHDGRTGHRFERSRSPSPERLVLSRSISMLRPREQM